MPCKCHPLQLEDCLQGSQFKSETRSCYCSSHLYFALFPCWEQQLFQRKVQWKVKAPNFVSLLRFNTNWASLEFERPGQGIKSYMSCRENRQCLTMLIQTFSDLKRESHQNTSKTGKLWIFIMYTHNIFLLPWLKIWNNWRQRNVSMASNDKGSQACVIWNGIFLLPGKDDICTRFLF